MPPKEAIVPAVRAEFYGVDGPLEFPLPPNNGHPRLTPRHGRPRSRQERIAQVASVAGTKYPAIAVTHSNGATAPKNFHSAAIVSG